MSWAKFTTLDDDDDDDDDVCMYVCDPAANSVSVV